MVVFIKFIITDNSLYRGSAVKGRFSTEIALCLKAESIVYIPHIYRITKVASADSKECVQSLIKVHAHLDNNVHRLRTLSDLLALIATTVITLPNTFMHQKVAQIFAQSSTVLRLLYTSLGEYKQELHTRNSCTNIAVKNQSVAIESGGKRLQMVM